MGIETIRSLLGDRQLRGVTPDRPIAAAARAMARHGVGALAVVEHGRLIGVLSERDIVWRAVAENLPLDTTEVRQIMTPDPVTISIDDAISDSLAAQLGRGFRHLPVMDGDMVVGLLSYRDIPAEYAAMFERFQSMSKARADEMA